MCFTKNGGSLCGYYRAKFSNTKKADIQGGHWYMVFSEVGL